MVDLRDRRRILNEGDKMRILQDCPCLTKEDVCKDYGEIGSNKCIRELGECREYLLWVMKHN